MARRLPFMAALCAAVALSGCSYLQHRGKDFQDCFKANLGTGFGLYAGVRATDVLNFPLGFFQASWRLGVDGRTRPQYYWPEGEMGGLLALDHWEFRGPEDEPGLSKARAWIWSGWLTAGGPEEDLPPPPYIHREYEGEEPSHGTRVADRYWLEAEVFALIVGARAGLNPVEMVDFLLGLVTVDILDDDRAAEAKATED